MKVSLISIDLAKNVFQVCGVNQAGKPIFNQLVKRNKLRALVANYPAAPIAMEACNSSNYWAREFQAAGHQVLLIPPQHVKPFVKGNKNDRNDAFAISEAARRPEMRCVQPRTLAQTDMILSHRIRARRVRQRTMLVSQIRGLLSEYGIVVCAGIERLRAALPLIIEQADNGLTQTARYCMNDLLDEWRALDERIKELDRCIAQTAKALPQTQRLMAVKGVGCMIATACVATLGQGQQFRNARHCAANVGLVPREHSSGGKQHLGGITKRGDRYLRYLLIQGAWNVLRHAQKGEDRLSVFARRVLDRRGKHKAVVAVAHKMIRIIWALLAKGQAYRAVAR